MMANFKSSRIISVIETTTKEGKGTEDDPNKIVTFYSSSETGELLAVNDPTGIIQMEGEK